MPPPQSYLGSSLAAGRPPPALPPTVLSFGPGHCVCQLKILLFVKPGHSGARWRLAGRDCPKSALSEGDERQEKLPCLRKQAKACWKDIASSEDFQGSLSRVRPVGNFSWETQKSVPLPALKYVSQHKAPGRMENASLRVFVPSLLL